MNLKVVNLTLGLCLVSSFVSRSQGLDTESKVTYRKPLFDFSYDKPLFKLQGEQLTNKNRFLRFSALTGYREGVEPTKGLVNFDSYLDRQNGTIRMYFINLSIQDILSFGTLKSNKVVLEVEDPSKYRYDPSQGSRLEWMRKNTYCFEYLFPFGSGKDVKPFYEELAHVFNVKFYRQKRLVDALVLVRTSTKDKIKSLNIGKGEYDMKGYFNNVPIDRLADPLNIAELPPMVDETKYAGNVDLNLKINSWKDLKAVRNELHRYDLDLKEEKREVEVLIITENQFNKK